MTELPPSVLPLIRNLAHAIDAPRAGTPSADAAHEFVDLLLSGLFPEHRSVTHPQTTADCLSRAAASLTRTLVTIEGISAAERISLLEDFFSKLPDLRRLMLTDAEALVRGDPASESLASVIQCYPGFFATAVYRVANFFWRAKVPYFPRLMTEHAHSMTGIDIHPGATIGESFFIDHGTGLVIGETAVIGARVKLYQGVTLGALSVDKTLAGNKRHPTLEDDVVVYAHATILGGETVIGHHSVIGGNVWITSSVAPHTIVYHRSEQKSRSLSPGTGKEAVPDWSI